MQHMRMGYFYEKNDAMNIWEQNTFLKHYLSLSSRDQRLLEIPNFVEPVAPK